MLKFFHWFKFHPLRILSRLLLRKDIKNLTKISKGRSRRCNFALWDMGQCPHGALLHAVPGCCKCFQQCRIAPKCPNSRSPSYPTLLEALATPWDSVQQCSVGTLSHVPKSKVASSGPTIMQQIFVSCNQHQGRTGRRAHFLACGETSCAHLTKSVQDATQRVKARIECCYTKNTPPSMHKRNTTSRNSIKRVFLTG